MAPFSYARRAILWRHNMVPFNGAILWHVCTRHYTAGVVTRLSAIAVIKGPIIGRNGRFIIFEQQLI